MQSKDCWYFNIGKINFILKENDPVLPFFGHRQTQGLKIDSTEKGTLLVELH